MPSEWNEKMFKFLVWFGEGANSTWKIVVYLTYCLIDIFIMVTCLCVEFSIAKCATKSNGDILL